MFRWLFQSKRRAKDVHGAERTNSSEAGTAEPALDAEPESEPEPVQVPLDGVLDLHTFRKSEVRELVRDYVNECRAHGVLALRIIHGKGNGTLRRITHAVLSDMPEAVASFELAERYRGGWGATVVDLKPLAVSAARSDRHRGDE
jgi:dsDNA-specific endonuclease/ATPase MutS2